MRQLPPNPATEVERRLRWCQARLSAKAVAGQPADETDVRDRLAAVRHHQLFFVGMHYRRRPTPSARRTAGSPAQAAARTGLAPGSRLAAVAAVRAGPLKGADLRTFSQADLDAIAHELNHRPRRTHGYRTPEEVYADLLNSGGALTA
ncbi:hypothetical protein GCM10010294_28260 [Streptomyces griseoloalbus]|nr:hypothetical protein GCM10010294_28260 [Streptomyces griseoloalbus]